MSEIVALFYKSFAGMKISRKSLALLGLASAAVIAAYLVVPLFAAGDEPSVAGSPAVSVVPIQTGPQTYGVAIVDVKNETICIYEINSRAATFNRLKLVAARSFRYDRLLESYNSAEPHPDQVRDIIRQASKIPAVNGNKPPVPESNTALSEPNK